MSTAEEGEIIPGTLSGRVESARGRQRSCMLHFDKDLQDWKGGRGIKDGNGEGEGAGQGGEGQTREKIGVCESE